MNADPQTIFKSVKRLTFILLLAGQCAVRADEPLSRIAFGSCANEHRPQPIWQAINEVKPQLFIFMGDNVYADTADPAKLKASYDALAAVPGFAKLRESTPIVATWDDHDYGRNDVGEEWEGKEASKEAFMEFFQTPAGSPRRNHGGVYDAKIFGPEGKRVQVILLDTRWFRGPLKRLSKDELKETRKRLGKKIGPYLPDTSSDSTMLGNTQWQWLGTQLRKPAELRLIVTSIQFVPIDHGWEKWGNLPREREKMLDLIRNTGARGVVFLSGDRHFAEISKMPGPDSPLFEVTSSGLNQKGVGREPNRFRLPKQSPYTEPNFGVVAIDWDQPDPAISLQIRNERGRIVRRVQTSLRELSNPAE